MAKVTVTTDSGLVIAQWDDSERLAVDATEGAIGLLVFGTARSALINEIRRAVNTARFQEKEGN